jgi:periplasmic protein TonB
MIRKIILSMESAQKSGTVSGMLAGVSQINIVLVATPVEQVKDVPKQEPKPVPPTQKVQDAREKASRAGLMPFAADLAELRSNDAVAAVVKDQPLTGVAGEAKRNERSMIASSVGKSSGGISTASMSRNTGGSGIGDRDATQVGSPIEGFGEATGPDVVSGGAAPSRSREEIEMIFDQNKGAIYALYTRALRQDPGLQGKVVLRMSIEPSGDVSMVEIVSSDLGDPELERKLVQRVKLFRFDAKDVARLTTTKPIDFFPA